MTAFDTGSDLHAPGCDIVLEAARALEAAGVESPRFEAQLLLASVLGTSRSAITAGIYAVPDAAQRDRYREVIAARSIGTPTAYLRGTREFYGIEFEVTPDVLIPRPETEMLVDLAIESYRRSDGVRPFRIADVGSGSGCIGIAILVRCPDARCISIDLDSAALRITRRNAERVGVSDRISTLRTDCLQGVAMDSLDLIISNPPYIPTGEIALLQREVRDFEPALALDGGPDGLTIYRRLVREASAALSRNGELAVEIGQGRQDEVSSIFSANGLEVTDVRADLAGILRVVAARRAVHGSSNA